MTTAERLYRLASDFAEAVGNVERWQTRADSAADSAPDPVTGLDRAAHTSMAETWLALVARRREELRAALRETLHGTVRAVPDDELPVATWQRGRVEVRATTTDGTRAVRVRYTPAQALAAGAALIACAAITDQKAGGTLAGVLAAFPPNPDSADEPPTGDDPGGRNPIGMKPAGVAAEAEDA